MLLSRCLAKAHHCVEMLEHRGCHLCNKYDDEDFLSLSKGKREARLVGEPLDEAELVQVRRHADEGCKPRQRVPRLQSSEC